MRTVIEPGPVETAPQLWLLGPEVSDQLDWEPAGFIRRRVVRRSSVHAADPDRATPIRARHQSRPIIERIRRALVIFRSGRQHLPQSLLGQAVEYAFGQWSTLEVYLREGRVEIDNNLVENAIRPTALGKKNWLFISEAGAGQRGAILYTINESSRRRKIDPYSYLRDVLTRLPHLTNHQVQKLTPSEWAKAESTTS